MTIIQNGIKEEKKCFINTVANGRRFAGGFLLTPIAKADDGLLDVCYIKELNLFHRFRILLKVPKGSHINDRKVQYTQVPELQISFSNTMPFHVDGELHFADRFEIKAIPKALKIIYNPEGKHFFGL